MTDEQREVMRAIEESDRSEFLARCFLVGVCLVALITLTLLLIK